MRVSHQCSLTDDPVQKDIFLKTVVYDHTTRKTPVLV